MSRRRNLAILMGIVAIALILIVLGSQSQNTAGGTVVVTIGGTEYGRYPLGDYREIVIDVGNGESNTLVIDRDGFYMKSATCRDQLCVGQGKVTKDTVNTRMLGTDIICLPHQLVVSLVSDEESASALPDA